MDLKLRTYLNQLKHGDSNGFVKIYEQYSAQVYNFCLSLTQSPEDAEEITSDVFVRIWQKRSSIQTDICLRPLLLKITRDLSWNYLKKKARIRENQLDFEKFFSSLSDQSDDAILFSQYEEMVQEAIKNLSPQQRKIFSLRYITGKDLNQISEELHLSKNTVKVHLAKAKKMILGYLPVNDLRTQHY